MVAILINMRKLLSLINHIFISNNYILVHFVSYIIIRTVQLLVLLLKPVNICNDKFDYFIMCNIFALKWHCAQSSLRSNFTELNAQISNALKCDARENDTSIFM